MPRARITYASAAAAAVLVIGLSACTSTEAKDTPSDQSISDARSNAIQQIRDSFESLEGPLSETLSTGVVSQALGIPIFDGNDYSDGANLIRAVGPYSVDVLITGRWNNGLGGFAHRTGTLYFCASIEYNPASGSATSTSVDCPSFDNIWSLDDVSSRT